MASTSEVVVEQEARPPERRSSKKWKRLISFPVFLGILLMSVAALQAHHHLADPDTWWHAKVGQAILATGQFPRHDIYSFTVKGNPWMAYEWLGEVAIGWAGRWGVMGLLMLLSGLGAALMLLLYIYGTICTKNVKASLAACAILLPLASVFFTLRPQLFGYCYLVGLLILMELYRQGHEKVLWAIPPLFLLWVNTHGTFFLGLGIFGVFWVCGLFHFDWNGLEAKPWTKRQSRNLLLTILASVAVLPLTPYGTKLAAYPLEMMLYQPLNIKSIQEWQPMNFGTAWGKAFLLMVLALFLVQLFWKPRFRLFDMVFLLATIAESAQHLRFMIVLIFAFLPWFAATLARWLQPYDERKDQYVLNVVLIAAILVGLVYLYPSRKKLDGLLAQKYPMKAISYMKSHHIPGPMFNSYGWGGYLIWTYATPHGTSHPVFIDGRADIYEYGGVLRDYLDIEGIKNNTPELLAKYKIRSALIHSDSSLATYLKALPGWKLVYANKLSDIFVFEGHYPTARRVKS